MKTTKTIILLSVLIVGLPLALFARGTAEDGSTVAPPWGAAEGPGYDEENKVTLTGKIFFDNLMHPVLKSGGKDYELMIPRMYLYSIELEEGETVTVEGYEADEPAGFMRGWRFQDEEEDNELHILVTKAIVDDVEWDLESSRYGYADKRGSSFSGPRGMGRQNQPTQRGGGPRGGGPRW